LSKGFKPTDELGELKNKLNIAVENEKFEDAIELRDQIKKLEKNMKEISELQSKLDDCVKKQDFENAIQYRDKINSLK
jgi:protein-arginine kinase activator protein McsA